MTPEGGEKMPGRSTLTRIRGSAVALFLMAVALLAAPQVAGAGTDVRIVARDGSVLSARSMDFGAPLGSRIVTVARGERFESPPPETGRAARWQGKYGFVYLDGFGLDTALDGLNEAGLGVAALFLPGPTRYPAEPPRPSIPALSNLKVTHWLLSQFDSVEQVKTALADISVFGERVESLGNWPLPLHFAVHDARGRSLVLEWIEGEPRVHDNGVGVLTNAPAFEWHLTNLRQFGRLSPLISHPIEIGSLTYAVTSQGTGLAGLPGDPSSASRFLATAATLNLSDRPKDAIGAIVLAQKLLNRVDIPRGLVRDYSMERRHDDYTQWASFRDHTNRKFFWRSYNDQTLRELDLADIDFSAGSPKRRAPIAVDVPSAIAIKPEDIPPVRP
jgi:choloylglycine hydrolase